MAHVVEMVCWKRDDPDQRVEFNGGTVVDDMLSARDIAKARGWLEYEYDLLENAPLMTGESGERRADLTCQPIFR